MSYGVSHELYLLSFLFPGELDHTASLERAALVTLMLLEELQIANESFTTALATGAGVSQNNTEHAQFLVKLAPRIRRLESDTSQCLGKRMEMVLQRLQELKGETAAQSSAVVTDDAASADTMEAAVDDEDLAKQQQQDSLCDILHEKEKIRSLITPNPDHREQELLDNQSKKRVTANNDGRSPFKGAQLRVVSINHKKQKKDPVFEQQDDEEIENGRG